jgi:SAM-dependent methyltransferase
VSTNPQPEGLGWQIGVWNRMSEVYLRQVDERFVPVIEQVINRAALQAGQQVLDLGTGTGSVAIEAARRVTPGGSVIGTDVSPEMLSLAQKRAAGLGLDNVRFEEGRGEAISAPDGAFDVVLASLSLMYMVDRGAAAREIGRALRPGGRFVAAVWAGPDQCDIVLFQQTAGRSASAPPVSGVGPGAMADPSPFLHQLAAAGVDAHVETESLGFEFDDFASAWDVLAGVTTAQLPPGRQAEAKEAVQAAMWPDASRPRHFTNVTQFIVGQRRP